MTFTVLFFAIMIAIAVGVGMPTLVRHVISPVPSDLSLIAAIWVAIVGIIFFFLSWNPNLAAVLTGVGSVALCARLLCEYVWKHVQCSRAVDAILALPAYVERRTFLYSLPQDIYEMVMLRMVSTALNESKPDLLNSFVRPAAPSKLCAVATYTPGDIYDKRH